MRFHNDLRPVPAHPPEHCPSNAGSLFQAPVPLHGGQVCQGTTIAKSRTAKSKTTPPTFLNFTLSITFSQKKRTQLPESIVMTMNYFSKPRLRAEDCRFGKRVRFAYNTHSRTEAHQFSSIYGTAGNKGGFGPEIVPAGYGGIAPTNTFHDASPVALTSFR